MARGDAHRDRDSGEGTRADGPPLVESRPRSGIARTENHHWVSSLNFSPEATEGFEFPEPLRLFDSTIRKAIYTTGVRPSIPGLLRIAEGLESLGVREIFLNVDFWGEEEPDSLEFGICREVLRRGFAFRTTVYSDVVLANPVFDRASDTGRYWRVIDLLREIGMEAMSVGLADPHEEAARVHQLEDLEAVLERLQLSNVSSALTIRDVGRASSDYLRRVTDVALRGGCGRLDLSDSTNALTPEAMKILVRGIRGALPLEVPVTMHVHDDFGLATACAIAAASAGAHPDVSVNGISYRAGFAALEEVATSLEILYGVPTGIDLSQLQEMSRLVSEVVGLPMDPLKPLVGPHAFLRELPQWVVPFVKGGKEMFPPPGSCIMANVVGADIRLGWGTRRCSEAVRAKLVELGLEPTQSGIMEIMRRIQEDVQTQTRYPQFIGEADVEDICRGVLAGPKEV